MTRTGKSGIALLSVLLMAASVAATLRVPAHQLPIGFALPWLVLVPLYLAADKFPIVFELRRETHALSFNQIPLALGALLLSPGHQLAARLTAAALVYVVARRQSVLKAAFNLAIAAVEVGAVTSGVALAGSDVHGPRVWLSLLAGVSIADIVAFLSVSLVMRAAGARRTRAESLRVLTFISASSVVCTSIAIIVLASVRTDPWTLTLVGALAGLLAYGYRSYRRLVVQQEATRSLYDFVKDLGPLTVDVPALPQVLEQIRVLLHAQTLDLAVPRSGGWQHVVVHEDGRVDHLAVLEHPAPASSSTTSRGAAGGSHDRMSATVHAADAAVLGILSAVDRLGNDREFDRGDVRLLETVANELAAALERGQLLSDLNRSATVDPLTGTPNLIATTGQLAALLAGEPGGVVVAALSVDSFREVNETLGHAAGDELLLEVSRRLARCEPDAVVGRIGGGRFAVAAPARSVDGDAALFGLRLRMQAEQGGRVGPIGTHVRLSVGVVRAPEHGTEASTLLRRAETAMSSARNSQGGPVVWEPAYEVEGQRRLALVTALREALATGAIGVAYQPKLAADGLRVTGVEALARWTHPALGAVSPDEFVPLAEASGLMAELTSTVLRQSLTACRGWQRRAGRVGVAVNVSADTVLDAEFVTVVDTALRATGVEPALLTIELTEGIAVRDPELAIERMQELRSLGVRLSVDDFGTGYSSLTYLKSLPVDEVKIDKGFVDDVVDDLADQAVVRSVVDIAHTRGLLVVAEGVETEAQHAKLAALGVDQVQGYLHARPMPSMDVGTWLRRREASNR